MAHSSELIAADIEAYLHSHENKDMLRILTCGSVDDGKSTLIGRLLFDSKMIFEDQLAAIKQDSQKFNTTSEDFDLALLVDGLQAEREQGITIDVAYRYFSTDKRKFIIADTPGHEQYTRNMVTGASTCELAIILIDARHGVQLQTRRHSFLCSLLGIKHFVVAINKMDRVDYREDRFNTIKDDYLALADKLDVDVDDIKFVPISALKGDNIVDRSQSTPWYHSETLLNQLETVQITSSKNFDDFRLPVQYVNRPNLDFRGYCGTVASGVIRVGDEITVQPSGKATTVKSIVTFDGELSEAFAGMAITLLLNDEIDISRGNLLVHSNNQADLTRTVNATLVWMAQEALVPGKNYDFRLSCSTTTGTIDKIDYLIDVNTLEQTPTQALNLNEIGHCKVSFSQELAVDAYQKIRGTGAFIVIDRLTNITLGAGMITGVNQQQKTTNQYSEFELELNALIRKHFPHWDAKDLRALIK